VDPPDDVYTAAARRRQFGNQQVIAIAPQQMSDVVNTRRIGANDYFGCTINNGLDATTHDLMFID
jgi:hypothetical protein